jgi:hypothetical protein
MKNPVITVANSLEPTERCGVLDEAKKALIIVLVTQGASRREAASFVKCHHTTIGRTAARDPKFASKLSQVEMAASLASNGLIRRASEDPKYWRAAAWMLERRNPEDYAKRGPNTFTADQVVSLLASVCSAALPTVQPDKVEEFYKYFDDAFDEIAEKGGSAADARKLAEAVVADQKDAQSSHLAPRDAESLNGATPSPNGVSPSRNGHHPPPAPPAPDATAIIPEPPAAPPEATTVRWPSEAVNGAAAAPPRDEDAVAIEEEVEALPYEDDAAADQEYADEFDDDFDAYGESDDDESDDLDIDWDRVDELHDAECRYVSADMEPDPVKRVAADRLVRLALAREQLRREANRKAARQSVHHPLHRLAAGVGSGLSHKALSSIGLRKHAKGCTTVEQTKGRCVNAAETAVGEPLPEVAVAAVDR